MAVWAMRRDLTRSDTHGLAFLGGPEALDEMLRRADYLAITLSLTESPAVYWESASYACSNPAPC